jgi:hypothetical protein
MRLRCFGCNFRRWLRIHSQHLSRRPMRNRRRLMRIKDNVVT